MRIPVFALMVAFCLPIVPAASALAADAPTSEATSTASAASAPVTAEKPWLYEGSDVPVDTSWTFGVLPNGLKYAVKKNDVPQGQIAIRVRIDAGSLYETDSEQGYAHLIEHLAFRGSTFVPDGESKRIWQRFGVNFGSDSNASTTPTQTVYKLDLPNSTPEKFSESMKILSGMMRAPNFTAQAVNAERSIVLAERRESASSAQAMGDALRAHFFKGQPYASRAPIGTVETLQGATADSLKAFHQRWYRPDKTVISIAGDMDPALLEAAVKEHFGNWKAASAPAPQPDFGKPSAGGNPAKTHTDASLPTVATIGWVRPWEQVNDTIVYNEQLLMDALALQIVNRRLENEARNGASFLFAEVGQEDVARSADVTTVTVSPLGDNWEQAVRDVRAIIADATATPPSATDIERERKLFETALQTRLDSYDFEAASKQADDIVNAVDIRETVAAPDTVVNVFRDLTPRITPQWMLESTQRLFAGDVLKIFLTAPVVSENAEQRLAAVLGEDIKANNAARLAQRELTMANLPSLGKAAAPVSRSKANPFGMEVLQFGNGVRALISSNKAETGQVRVLVRFGRGYQAVAPKDAALLWTGPVVLNSNGIGKLRQSEIEQIVNGRRIQLGFDIDDNAFELSATTSTADLSDQLKLLALKLEKPGWDPAPVQRGAAFVKSGYDAFQMSASAVLQRDLEYLLRSGDPRWKQPDPADANAITPENVKAFWQPLLQSGPVEVIIMGDFEPEAAVTALSQSFGAMQPRRALAAPPAAKVVRFPAANSVPKTLTHKGPQDQAAAAVAWPTAGGIARVQESRELEILAAVFRDRMFEKFRSEQAASYSPDMASNWPIDLDNGGYLVALSQVSPGDVDRFFAFADEVAADLAAQPVTADELKRAVEPVRQLIERIATGNTFWLNELEGASYDSRKFDALRYILTDYSSVTPQRIQQLAQTYLQKDKAWKLQVLPESVATANGGASGN